MIAAFLLALSLPAAAAPYPAVRDDARVELLAAVRLLAGDGEAGSGFFRRKGAYEDELWARVSPLARHPVVEKWQELEKAGLGYVAAHQWLLSGAAPEAMTRAAGGAAGVEEFRLLLADFAAAAEWSKLFAETAPLRAPLLQSVRKQAETLRIREDLEKYAGAPAPPYELIVSAFAEPAIAVTFVSSGALTSLTGPEEHEGKVILRLGTRRGTLWAEALREMLRPAAAANAPALKASRPLFASVAGRCAADWEECALRQISFAAAGLLLRRAGEKDAADETPVKYARVGMPHIAALMKSLDARKSGTLAAYYPRLAAALAAELPSAAPFSGSMAEALSAPGACALIAPGNPSAELSAALASFARDRRFCDAAPGAGVTLVVAAEENWLRARWKELRLPLTFVAGGLELGPRPGEAAGRTMKGDLSVATVARNPDDPSRPALVFTSARALSGFTGRFDYEIFDGTAAVKSGLYEKSRLPWRPK